MLKPEEVRGSLLPDAYIKEHGVFYFSLSDEYYFDGDGVYHYERMFDKPMDEGGKPFTGLAFEVMEDSDQIGFYIEMKDGYFFGDYVRYFENGALRGFTRKDEKEWYGYEWFENGVLKESIEFKQIRGKKSRFSLERFSTEYDETGKPLRNGHQFLK